MNNSVVERVLNCAEYIVSNNATLRQAARAYHVGKSTVHSDMNNRLPKIDYQLFCRVKEILRINMAERHLRGGESTKKAYLEKRKRGIVN